MSTSYGMTYPLRVKVVEFLERSLRQVHCARCEGSGAWRSAETGLWDLCECPPVPRKFPRAEFNEMARIVYNMADDYDGDPWFAAQDVALRIIKVLNGEVAVDD